MIDCEIKFENGGITTLALLLSSQEAVVPFVHYKKKISVFGNLRM